MKINSDSFLYPSLFSRSGKENLSITDQQFTSLRFYPGIAGYFIHGNSLKACEIGYYKLSGSYFYEPCSKCPAGNPISYAIFIYLITQSKVSNSFLM